MDPAVESTRLRRPLGQLLTVVSFDSRQAEEAANLRPLTRHLGLSLGDRACLALGLTLGLPILAADRSWDQLPTDYRIELIR